MTTTFSYKGRVIKSSYIAIVMVFVAVSIHHARMRSAFFGGLTGLSDVKIQKIHYFGKYQSQETESCIFLNSFIRALM